MEKFDSNAPIVKLVDTDGTIKEMKTEDVKAKAEEVGLDIVCVRGGDVPIVKLCDFNKLIYEKKKKEKENIKKQRSSRVETKEIRLGRTIAENDLKTKARNADKFIKHGDKVEITVQFKGRTVKLIDTGKEVIEKMLNLMTEEYKVVKDITIQGAKVAMTIGPTKTK